MINNLFKGSYINEKEQRSYPIGTPSKGYDASGKAIPAQSSFLSSNPAATVAPPVVTQAPPPVRSKYIDPATGEFFKTAQEYGNYIASKIPKGDIPKTATDAIINPNQTTTQLESTARNLNNARNDLAVGETTMFAGSDKTAGGEQIIYSPAEKEAIRKASAGIYDPALNDVFARLKEQKTKEESDIKAKQDRENQIFATNESIRQWKATTGTKGGSDDSYFSNTQIAKGSTNAGTTIDGFNQLDKDLQNFFIQDPVTTNINTQTGKVYTQKEWFNKQFEKVKNGEITKEDLVDDIIASTTMAESVKHYFIDQIPEKDPAVKQNWFMNVWKAVTNQ